MFSPVANFLYYEKGKILYTTFVMSNFNYCPLIWMYHGKPSSNRVDRVQKRDLRIFHNDFSLPFEEILRRTDERNIQTKNLQKLMLQIYKFLIEESPSFMWNVFEKRYVKYELRTIKSVVNTKFKYIYYWC